MELPNYDKLSQGSQSSIEGLENINCVISSQSEPEPEFDSPEFAAYPPPPQINHLLEGLSLKEKQFNANGHFDGPQKPTR